MSRAMSARNRWLGVLFALPLSWLVPTASALAGEPSPSVAVQYRLLTEFSGTEKSGGRIYMTLVNRSPYALHNVTVRLADPAVVKLTGLEQESVELAVGEARQLEGEFVIDNDALNALRPLEWIVVATEATGFAQQTIVRGELMPAASADADTRAATH